MIPLKVSCYAFNGIASDGYLPLDSILAAIWMREHHPDAYYNNSVAAKDELIEADLPIKRIDHGNGWYYACSFCQAIWSSGSISHWHKRSTLNEQIRYLRKGRLNLAQGKTKAYRMPIFLLHAGTRLTWYLTGDQEWLIKRLPLIGAIGKKRAMGNGVVCDWQVEPIDENYSILKDGYLMRSIPIPEVAKYNPTHYRIANYALRPPYWHRDNQMDLAVPETL